MNVHINKKVGKPCLINVECAAGLAFSAFFPVITFNITQQLTYLLVQLFSRLVIYQRTQPFRFRVFLLGTVPASFLVRYRSAFRTGMRSRVINCAGHILNI